jgi:hypothetical protein
MKPASVASLVIAALCRLACAQAETGGTAAGGGLAPGDLLWVIGAALPLMLSLAAISLWRDEKDGSVRKRFADFSALVAIFNPVMLLFWIIAFLCFALWSSGWLGWACIIAPLPVAVFICRRNHPETSAWNRLLAAFLFTLLFMLIGIAVVFSLLVFLPRQ